MCVVTKKHVDVPFYLMSVYGFTVGIISLISYVSIESSYQGYNLIIDNWDLHPISSIRVSKNMECDPSYE